MSSGDQQKAARSAEHARLAEGRLTRGAHWPRMWGTVREDYGADGAAWRYFPFDDARSRAYRWSDDGLAGLRDREQRRRFALTFWNGATLS